MNSVMRFLVWGTIPLGTMTGGVLASTIGLRPTLFVGAAGALLSTLPILLSRAQRTLVEFPEPEEPELGVGAGDMVVVPVVPGTEP